MAEKQTSKDRMREIVDSIETGIKELFESDKYRQYLSTMSRFHRYSVNNTMLIYMQRPDATHVAGFNKWRDQFGRNVMKGEKGIKIIAPTPYKKKIEEVKLDPDTKTPMLDADGKVMVEEKEVKIPMYKVVSVFDVSQTEGKPLPQLASDLNGNVQQYVGRIQPKYYLKYAKSLEEFQHGVISAVIIYKMLLYFLESDFNLNDDYIYKEEDARQFYIRREILRAISSHTCPDAYNIHITTFSSLLFLCDELQEWGRKAWNELYTGLSESSISLKIETFSHDLVIVEETVDMKNITDTEIVAQNIGRVFERQYSLYKTTFRDGQYTVNRDFSLKKSMIFQLPEDDAKTMEIKIEYSIPKTEESYFKIDLNSVGTAKEEYKEPIKRKISKSLYSKDVCFA